MCQYQASLRLRLRRQKIDFVRRSRGPWKQGPSGVEARESNGNHDPDSECFKNFLNVLPTAQVGCYAGKPIESAV